VTCAYVFPGEGSQHRGMGQGLFDQYPDLVEHADECLGYSIRELCLHDPQGLLSSMEFAQPALYVVNVLSHVDRVGRAGRIPEFVAGHGVGEYCALFAAGAFDFETGLTLVQRRGTLMSRAPRGGMAAVTNLSPSCVEHILGGLPYRNVDIAHLNSRMQCTLSGPDAEIFAPPLRDAFAAKGAGFTPLNVTTALHSRCMADVEREFADHLSRLEVRELNIPVVANYTARPYPAGNYVHYLALQISNPVRWYESMSWLIGRGCWELHEIGPGRALTALSESILRDPLKEGEEPVQDAACGVAVEKGPDLQTGSDAGSAANRDVATPLPLPSPRRNQAREPLPRQIRRSRPRTAGESSR
jgi:trans-AT polyketide synthase, acyltransferase and oxidoreductase domains